MSKSDKKPWDKRVDINLSFSYAQCSLIYEAIDILNTDMNGDGDGDEQPEASDSALILNKIILAQVRRSRREGLG